MNSNKNKLNGKINGQKYFFPNTIYWMFSGLL